LQQPNSSHLESLRAPEATVQPAAAAHAAAVNCSGSRSSLMDSRGSGYNCLARDVLYMQPVRVRGPKLVHTHVVI
jgi:hypothetical protein